MCSSCIGVSTWLVLVGVVIILIVSVGLCSPTQGSLPPLHQHHQGHGETDDDETFKDTVVNIQIKVIVVTILGVGGIVNGRIFEDVVLVAV